MKKNLKLFLSFVVIFFCFMTTSKATHLMGGEITWQYLNTDTYLVSASMYRDCNGIALYAQDVVLTDCKLNIITLSTSAKQIFAKDITPVCKKSCTKCTSTPNGTNIACTFAYGVELFIYQQKIIIPKSNKCCNFLLSWNNCCRNFGINTGAASQSFYLESMLNRCIKPDNSPYFSIPSTLIVPINQCTTLNFSAQDDDHDSLVYSIYKPLQYGATTWGGEQEHILHGQVLIPMTNPLNLIRFRIKMLCGIRRPVLDFILILIVEYFNLKQKQLRVRF